MKTAMHAVSIVDEETAPASGVRPVVQAQAVAYEPTTHDIREHMHLVYRVVSQMQRKLPRNVERDELVAAGIVGLLDAIRKNHTELGSSSFECYARIRIRGAILDDLRQLDWSPRRRRSADGSPASAAAPISVVGIDDLGVGTLPHATTSSPHELTERLELCRAVDDALAQLPERDRKVLELRYIHDVPAKEIAVLLGVSEARVSQLHARATTALRGLLAEYDERKAA